MILNHYDHHKLERERERERERESQVPGPRHQHQHLLHDVKLGSANETQECAWNYLAKLARWKAHAQHQLK